MKARKSRATGCVARFICRRNPGPTSRTASGSSRTGGRSINWCAARRMATPKSGLAGPACLHDLKFKLLTQSALKAHAPRTINLMNWIGWAILSAVFAAATALLAKVGVAHVDSNLAMALRTTVVVVFAWGIALALGKHGEIRTLDRRTVLFLALSGLATGLSWLCYFRALQLGPASRVAPLDKLSVPLVMVFAWLLLGEKLTGPARRRPAHHRGSHGHGAGLTCRSPAISLAYTGNRARQKSPRNIPMTGQPQSEAPPRRIVLTGFMGSGKTTVGPLLAAAWAGASSTWTT
jgi:transporter family protein